MNKKKNQEGLIGTIWLPVGILTIGIAIWFFLFVILDLGG